MTKNLIWWNSLSEIWKEYIASNCTYSIDEIDNNPDILDSISSISLKQKGITDITPIKHFSNLRYLNLSDNLIEDITPISELFELEYLNLSENNIKSIKPIFGLLNLQFLFLNEACKIVNSSDYNNFMLHSRIGGGSYTSEGYISAKDSLEKIRITECTNENGENIGFDISPLGLLNKLSYLEIFLFPCCVKSNMSNIRRLKFYDGSGFNISDLKYFPNISILDIYTYDIPSDLSILNKLEELAEFKIYNYLNESYVSNYWLKSDYPEYFK